MLIVFGGCWREKPGLRKWNVEVLSPTPHCVDAVVPGSQDAKSELPGCPKLPKPKSTAETNISNFHCEPNHLIPTFKTLCALPIGFWRTGPCE